MTCKYLFNIIVTDMFEAVFKLFIDLSYIFNDEKYKSHLQSI